MRSGELLIRGTSGSVKDQPVTLTVSLAVVGGRGKLAWYTGKFSDTNGAPPNDLIFDSGCSTWESRGHYYRCYGAYGARCIESLDLCKNAIMTAWALRGENPPGRPAWCEQRRLISDLKIQRELALVTVVSPCAQTSQTSRPLPPLDLAIAGCHHGSGACVSKIWFRMRAFDARLGSGTGRPFIL